MNVHRKKWWQIAALFLLTLLVLGIRAWGFENRILGYAEGQDYLALCAQSGAEKNLWIYRMRELVWPACGMVLGATLSWYFAGAWCGSLLICILGICPNEWWILLPVVAATALIACVQKGSVWKKVPACVPWIFLGGIEAAALALLLFSTIESVNKNEEDWRKMDETLSVISNVSEGMILFNQPKYEDFLSYYIQDGDLFWHEEVKLDDIEKEYAYLIYEEGLWFADRDVKKYGITYTDMGELWFPGVEKPLRLLQVQWGKYSAIVRSEQAVKDIVSKHLDSVIIPMYPMQNFEEEYFEVFINSKIVNLDTVMFTGKQLIGAMEYILNSTDSLKTVYVGLDQNELGEEDRQSLLSIVQSYPELDFRMLLATPEVEELTLPGHYENWEKNIAGVVNALDGMTNVEMEYVGNTEWLFINKGTYNPVDGYEDRVAKDIAAKAFMLQQYPIHKENLKEHLDRQEKLVAAWNAGAYGFEEGVGKTIVFIGDSVFGYTQGTVSIPGVVENLFGAKTYNLGYGGMSATSNPEQMRGVWQLWQGALTGDVEGNHLTQNADVCEQIKEVVTEGVLTQAQQGENLIFVLNFGLNDYFKGEPLGTLEDSTTDTYLGAMQAVMGSIKEKYPAAVLLVLTPNHVVEFEYGTRKTGEDGNVLQDYRDGITALAEKMGVLCMDVNKEIGLNKENHDKYLADGTHPNFYGNFCYGVAIAELLESVLK